MEAALGGCFEKAEPVAAAAGKFRAAEPAQTKMVAGASGGKALLLRLQGAAKADPEGHVEDFRR